MPRSPPPALPGLFDRPPPREPRVLTVLELTRRLKGAVEPAFTDVWVAGEVSNLRRQPSGHVYFGLTGDDASIDAVLWATVARRVRFDLRDGTEVVARGRVEIYAPRGRYQLVVQEVEPRGAGARAVALQQLRERLAAEGLFDAARKRPLPFLPERIGVATSTSGAALRDFLRVVHSRFPGIPVVVANCRVQGEGAAATVISALRLLQDAGVDVAVVTRGGGSSDDLWEFNDERLARAIAASPVPVVSAVGHEVDTTVADQVADLRAATPTHAAELVVPVRDDLAEGLGVLRNRLARAWRRAVEDRRQVLRALRAELSDPRRVLSDQRRRLDEGVHRLDACLSSRVREERARLAAAGERLRHREPRAQLRDLRRRREAARDRLIAWSAATFRRESMRLADLSARLEPANVAGVLGRGFALALHEGRPLRRSAEVEPGASVRVVLGEGWVDARVESRDAPPAPIPGLPARAEEE